MENKDYFIEALPVWGKEKEYEMNYFLRFSTIIQENNAVIKIAANSIYRIFINNKFISSGPARAAHGYYRVDELDISDYLCNSKNEIVIEVGAYNVNSYYLLDQPGFLQCEIFNVNGIITATGGKEFIAERIGEKKQKVQRYSFQRTFCEEYDFTNLKENNQIDLEVVGNKKLIERKIPYEKYEKREINKAISNGQVIPNNKREKYTLDRYVSGISEKFKGYKIEQLESFITKEVEEMDFVNLNNNIEVNLIHNIEKEGFKIFDLGINSTGIISINVITNKDVQLYLIFDEILIDNDINFTRLDCANVIKYKLKAGEYNLLTFEPYTFRYLKIVALGGSCIIKDLHIKQIIYPIELTKYKVNNDRELELIYDSAVETFKQNVVDIYMDCPSRERAGWLCDSFFTARVEHCLTGKSVVERNFLENFLLPDKFEFLPKGMFPMCYPADHNDGTFIPNWSMWLVLELKEYLQRTNDIKLIYEFKEKIYQLLNYFRKFENEDGLLENLEGWVFVEWSKCNDFVQDVNYPSNMLYVKMLKTVSELYNDNSLEIKANKIKEKIIKQSFDGEFFIDNSIRESGILIPSGEKTETCQYYAFFCDIATIEEYPELWDKLLNSFGPKRKFKNLYPEVYFSNAFIGNYLRLELLHCNGYKEKVLDEIKGYFMYMANRTMTLWEHDSEVASCNHGFASHIIYWIMNQ